MSITYRFGPATAFQGRNDSVLGLVFTSEPCNSSLQACIKIVKGGSPFIDRGQIIKEERKKGKKDIERHRREKKEHAS